MDSFYGGHQGASFIIRARFPSVKEMKDNFKLGPGYTDVWFGEYCMIDTPNKNDPDNGKIFRRGAEYSKQPEAKDDRYEGDAIEIGQIVGPSSGLPLVEFTTIDKIIDGYAKENRQLDEGNGEQRLYPYVDEEDNSIKSYYDRTNDGGDEIPTIIDLVPLRDGNGNLVDEDGDSDGYQLVSGKTHDSIKWTWCTIRYNDSDDYPYSVSKVYLGFDMPYHYFEVNTTPSSPYDDQSAGSTCEYGKIDGKENPFYHIVTLNIPFGIPGISFTDMAIVTWDDSMADGMSLYKMEDIEINPAISDDETERAPYATIKQGPSFSPIVGQRSLVVCMRCYDTVPDPMPRYVLADHPVQEEGAQEPIIKYKVLQQDSEYSGDKGNYDVQNGRVRSIWIYLGEYNEPKAGTMIRQKPENEGMVAEYLYALNNDGTLILYDDAAATTYMNKWWTPRFIGNAIEAG